ncbi:MAG TPA: hypothetical protein VK722_01040 [Candidatus Aquilonibacter sp.]|jgi:hypothetical protein|nr:hypothetical protein [Candidatus Aquilonibacter sp.]
MFTEVAKPITLVFCILSLYAAFYAAFLDFSLDFDRRIYSSLAWLAVAAGISLVSAWIFRGAMQQAGSGRVSLAATLPLKIFFWASSAMLLLFLVSWYLETNCIFYRDVRRL